MESRNGFWKFQKVDFKVPVLVKKKYLAIDKLVCKSLE